MKKYVIALLFLCAAAYAQSPLGLQYPFGIPDMALTGSAAALGGGGTAVAEEHFGMSLNPANIAIGKRSAFSATVSFDFTTISDGGAESGVSGYSPKLLSLILPLGAVGNFGFSMQKRYDANLNYYTETVIQDAEGYKANTIRLRNVGGLTAWQAGWGYRLKNGLGIGFAYEKLFFNKDSYNVFESALRYNTTEGSAATYRTNTQESAEISSASDGLRFGLQVPITEKITAAAAGEYVFQSENGMSEREYTRSDEGLIHQSGEKFSVRVPPAMNIGLAYKPDIRWLIAADARTVLWDEYEDSRGKQDNLRNTYGASAGARFIPAISRLSAKYWERILYSAGLRYDGLPIEGAHEYAASLGVGLPIPGEGGLVDIIFEFGRRTDERYPKYSENTVKFMLGINGGRNWFQGSASDKY